MVIVVSKLADVNTKFEDVALPVRLIVIGIVFISVNGVYFQLPDCVGAISLTFVKEVKEESTLYNVA